MPGQGDGAHCAGVAGSVAGRDPRDRNVVGLVRQLLRPRAGQVRVKRIYRGMVERRGSEFS